MKATFLDPRKRAANPCCLTRTSSSGFSAEIGRPSERSTAPGRAISVVTYMELLQGARSRREARSIRAFLGSLHVGRLPRSEDIGHRAVVYMKKHGLAGAMTPADALVAATSVENRRKLVAGNTTHYTLIAGLELHVFRPRQPRYRRSDR